MRLSRSVKQRSLWPELLQDFELTGRHEYLDRILHPAGGNPFRQPLPPRGQRCALAVCSDDARAWGGRTAATPEPNTDGASTAGASKTLGELRIEGAGIHSADNPGARYPVGRRFCEELARVTILRQSGRGDRRAARPDVAGQTFTFTLRAKLLKPITL